MAECEVCGNDYDKSFDVIAAGDRHTFDSFECAISRLAPRCEHCGCAVIGHGAEVSGRFYCCAHCAREAEHTDEVVDRVPSA
jgi:Rieske Fe-S protein